MVGFAVGLAVLYLTAGAWMVGLSMVTGALLLRLAVKGRRPSAGRVKRRRRVWSEEERKFILERDGFACVDCGTRRGRLEIDHVLPVRTRPDLAFSPTNLATRCPRCHSKKTRIECGWKPTDPARLDWRKAVAALGAETSTEQKE